MNDVIRVGWLSEDGFSGFVEHSIGHYGGVVPVIGDKLAVVFGENGKATEVQCDEVVDRFCVCDVSGEPCWYIVLRSTELPKYYESDFMREWPDLYAEAAAIRLKRTIEGIVEKHKHVREEPKTKKTKR